MEGGRETLCLSKMMALPQIWQCRHGSYQFDHLHSWYLTLLSQPWAAFEQIQNTSKCSMLGSNGNKYKLGTNRQAPVSFHLRQYLNLATSDRDYCTVHPSGGSCPFLPSWLFHPPFPGHWWCSISTEEEESKDRKWLCEIWKNNFTKASVLQESQRQYLLYQDIPAGNMSWLDIPEQAFCL